MSIAIELTKQMIMGTLRNPLESAQDRESEFLKMTIAGEEMEQKDEEEHGKGEERETEIDEKIKWSKNWGHMRVTIGKMEHIEFIHGIR